MSYVHGDGKMRLFAVTIRYDMVVYAKSLFDAENVARDNARECLLDLTESGIDSDASLYPEEYIPKGYDDDCCAYGGGNKSIGELRGVK